MQNSMTQNQFNEINALKQEQIFLKQTIETQARQFKEKNEQLQQKLIHRDAKYQKKSQQLQEMKLKFE